MEEVEAKEEQKEEVMIVDDEEEVLLGSGFSISGKQRPSQEKFRVPEQQVAACSFFGQDTKRSNVEKSSPI